MSEYRLSPEAEADLDEIWVNIARESGSIGTSHSRRRSDCGAVLALGAVSVRTHPGSRSWFRNAELPGGRPHRSLPNRRGHSPDPTGCSRYPGPGRSRKGVAQRRSLLTGVAFRPAPAEAELSPVAWRQPGVSLLAEDAHRVEAGGAHRWGERSQGRDGKDERADQHQGLSIPGRNPVEHAGDQARECE